MLTIKTQNAMITIQPTNNPAAIPTPQSRPEIIISPIHRLSTNLIDYRQIESKSKVNFYIE